jgi:hypothetical protein
MFWEIFVLAIYGMIAFGLWGETANKRGQRVSFLQAVFWPVTVSSFVFYALVKYLNGD